VRTGAAACLPYHSWTFDSAGANRGIKWEKRGCYGEGFAREDHNLARVARFGEYRGFLFASLNADVPSLDEHLGEARKLIDLVVDKSPEGVELVPGRVRFTYAANWKMQLENCSDQYHFTSTHPSYIRILNERAQEETAQVVTASLSNADFWKEDASGITGGTYCFDHGHVLNWGLMGVTAALPEFERADALAEELGVARRNWIFNMRNLTLFPNMQIAENASSQLRMIRPIAPNLTEMQTWCIARAARAPRHGNCASVSMRTSSTPPAWRRLMTRCVTRKPRPAWPSRQVSGCKAIRAGWAHRWRAAMIFPRLWA
jgi:benzoate/toluate 1,2-dioxygenase alpha subunit